MKITYEIPQELLLELMAITNVATETFDERASKAHDCQRIQAAADYSELGWRSAEAWRWLTAIRDGEEFKPEPFALAHCLKCGDRTDTGEPHDCGEEG